VAAVKDVGAETHVDLFHEGTSCRTQSAVEGISAR